MATKYVLLVDFANLHDARPWEVMREDLFLSLCKAKMHCGISIPLTAAGLTQETLRDYTQALNDYDSYYENRGPRMSDEEQVRADSYELKMKGLEEQIVAAVKRVIESVTRYDEEDEEEGEEDA